MRYIVLGIAVTVAGCVTSKETYMPSGKKGHVISCPSGGGLVGKMKNWGTCYQKAGEICGAKGYAVLTKSDEQGFSAIANEYGAQAGTTNNRMMIIQCNEGAPEALATTAPAPRPK